MRMYGFCVRSFFKAVLSGTFPSSDGVSIETQRPDCKGLTADSDARSTRRDCRSTRSRRQRYKANLVPAETRRGHELKGRSEVVPGGLFGRARVHRAATFLRKWSPQRATNEEEIGGPASMGSQHFGGQRELTSGWGNDSGRRVEDEKRKRWKVKKAEGDESERSCAGRD